MIITQKKHRKLRESLDNIQSLICVLKVYGICLGDYKDCQSNTLCLIAHKLEEMGLDSCVYIYQVSLPPYHLDTPQRLVLKIKWKSIDDFFKEATDFTLIKMRSKLANTISKR